MSEVTAETSEIDPGTAFLMKAFDPAHLGDPYPLYAEMREVQPVLDSGIGIWFAFRHAAAHGLLRARNTSSDERRSNEFQATLAANERMQRFAESEPLMLFMDPPDHTRLRRLVSRAFTPRTVEQMRPRLCALAEQMMDALDGAGPVDFVEHVGYRFPVTVICELLGVPVADIELFQSMSEDLSLMIEPGALRTEEQEDRIEVAREQLAIYIQGLLNARRTSPGDDLISALLAVRDGADRLTEPELISLVILLLLAGHETTVNLIGNGLVALLRNPEQLERWRDDPSLSATAIDEITRYDSPVQIAMRVILEPTEIDGVTVPAGDQVITLLGSANRDPAVFERPDELDLGRENAAMNLSFGGGIHHCLGMALARAEAEIVLGTLVANFDVALVEEPPMRERFVLRGYEKIMVDVTRRS